MQVYIVALFLFSNIIGINAWTTLDASWTENCNNGMLGRKMNDYKFELNYFSLYTFRYPLLQWR